MSPAPSRPSFQDLHRTVLDALFDGSIRPGERLGIAPLASKFGVSATPLREILSRLVGQGLVEERRAEGYYVIRVEGRTLAQSYELHALYMDITLRGGSRRVAVPDHADAWRAFKDLVEAAPNVAVRDAQAFTALRLRLVRRCEAALLDDSAQQAKLVSLLTTGDLREARRAVRVFHRIRAAKADLIAFEANRPNPIR